MWIKAVMLVGALQAPQREIDRVVESAIRDGVFPGAVVVIGTSAEVLYSKGYGHYTWSLDAPVPSPDSTLFDLASLTKVVATTPAVMRLIDEGTLRLGTLVKDVLPAFEGQWKSVVTVRHLLAHTSGLRSFLPLNEIASTSQEARGIVLSEPLSWRPDSRVEYSDLNAMLLGWIVEEVSGATLDDFVSREIYDAAGMQQTRFGVTRSVHDRVMPVGLWRGHVISGQLHDQNAVRLGGVSGHAGLYSTASDLARYAQILLNKGTVAGGVLFSEWVVDIFTRRQRGNRALGWEMRDTTSTDNTGSLLSPAAFGHSGFTGTSMWIDPDLDLLVVFLTNRVFAPRVPGSISRLKEVRAAIADGAALMMRAQSLNGRQDARQTVILTEADGY